MADIIDFEAKKKELNVEVSLEDEGQRLLEAGIVSLWEVIGGSSLRKHIDDDLSYLFLFLQFSGVCFENMEEENIIIDEDGNMGIIPDLREALEDAIEDIARELKSSDKGTN